MSAPSRSVLLVTVVACIGSPVGARAQGAPPSDDDAIAEALFQEGRQLMARGNTAEACAKLAESQRLEPATGTLLNLAACHEAEGKLASAWVELNEAVPRAHQDGRPDREAYAKQRIAALEPQLSRLTISVASLAQQSDLSVMLDGVLIGVPAWGMAAPINAGAHEIRATAPGKRVWKMHVDIDIAQKGQQLNVLVPVLETSAAMGTPGLSAAQATPADERGPAIVKTRTAAGPTHRRRNAGIVLLGVGAASVATGAVFGVRAFNFWKERDNACPRAMCTRQAVRAHDDASTSAKIADVAFGVGVATLGAGAYLFFSAHDHERTAQILSPATRPPAVALLPFISAKSGGVEVACQF